MPGRRVLLVGAYERDNFGDLLFLALTRERLLAAGASLMVSAPIAADMRELVDEFVLPTGLALQRHDFDVIWVVGGEVGTTTLGDALRFSLTAAEHHVLASAPSGVRAAAIAALTHDHESPGAYVPDPSRVEGAEPRLVLHSVGVAGLGGAPEDDPRMDALVRAGTLTVRDNASSEMLSTRGVRHRLAPDLVHTIRTRVPREPGPGSGRVLVQASTRSLDAWGDDAFVDAVAEIATRGPVTLFAAGTANAHDSLSRYEEVRRAVLSRRRDADVDVAYERDPLELVRLISRSEAWIGSSLHGRVVASAYGLPRVSLTNAKVAAYAATWDPVMPADVPVAEAPAALDAAVTLAQLPEADVGSRLAELAEDAWSEAVVASGL